MQLSVSYPVDWIAWTLQAGRKDRVIQNQKWLLPIVQHCPEKVPSIYTLASMLAHLDMSLKGKLLYPFVSTRERQEWASKCGDGGIYGRGEGRCGGEGRAGKWGGRGRAGK